MLFSSSDIKLNTKMLLKENLVYKSQCSQLWDAVQYTEEYCKCTVITMYSSGSLDFITFTHIPSKWTGEEKTKIA